MEKNVVVSYLEKIHQDLFERILNLERELQKKVTLRNNNQRFIDKLKKSLDNNLELFSPRKLNPNSHDKILSLQSEQNLIESEISQIEENLKILNLRIEELEIVLDAERNIMKIFLEKSSSLKLIKEYHREILRVHDLERQRTAKQLYDTMIQNYDHMIHKIEVCSRLVNVDVMGSHKELGQMVEYMKDSMQNMLRIVYDIPFFPLVEMNLEELIKKELSIFENKNIQVFFEIEGNKVELSKDIKLTVMKVVKESCDNVIKYANAKMIRIQINYESSHLRLVVEDDGNGFDLKVLQDENKIGVGISSMKQRLYLLDGKLDIISSKGKGTMIMIDIPFHS